MTGQAFSFQWVVHASGYSWVEHSRVGQRMPWFELAEAPSPHEGVESRSYAPLREYTGLFRTLADTAGTREAVLEFANRYGRLGLAEESLQAWTDEIWALRQAVHLWELVRADDRLGLHRHIRWEGKGEQWTATYDSRPDLHESWHDGFPHTHQVIASTEVNLEWLERLKSRDVKLAALIYLWAKVNEHLRETSNQLLYEPEHKRLVLQPVPGNLIGAIWLQFASAVSADKDYRRCRECGTWFELSPETARTNRRFCSGACRSKAYRERQGRAQEMYAEGKSLRQIARELDTDLAVIQRWVLNKKE
jgi:hypothetical protein